MDKITANTRMWLFVALHFFLLIADSFTLRNGRFAYLTHEQLHGDCTLESNSHRIINSKEWKKKSSIRSCVQNGNYWKCQWNSLFSFSLTLCNVILWTSDRANKKNIYKLFLNFSERFYKHNKFSMWKKILFVFLRWSIFESRFIWDQLF